jgi:hypothetical protein
MRVSLDSDSVVGEYIICFGWIYTILPWQLVYHTFTSTPSISVLNSFSRA